MPRKKQRLAAIDVGTNSIHMLLVEAQRNGYRILDKEKEMVQLGRGSLSGEPLTDDAMRRGVEVLVRMSEIARRWDADEITGVATSAVREAPNRRKFLRDVEKNAGLKLRVISGDDEADYIYRSVRAAADFHGGTGVIIDIGGGSVELIVATADEVFLTESLRLGALRLHQRFFASDRPTINEIVACRTYARQTMRKPVARIKELGFDFCIGTSGTINSLAEICGGSDPGQQAEAGMHWIERSDLEEMLFTFGSQTIDERAEQFSLEARRAETIFAGAIVLYEFLEMLSIDEMRSCTAALREGIVERWMESVRRGNGIRPAPRIAGGVRRSSVSELLEKSDHDRAHALQVARLALRIFDQTGELHELRELDRELLEYAALAHEIGIHISFKGHHRHTYYLLRHAGLRGFTDDQVAVVANVARYYRKNPPDEAHPNLAELTPGQRGVVSKLSAILRIAEGLDRGHKQAVRDVAVQVGDKHVRFFVRPRMDAKLEVESGRKRAKYFSKLFEREISFESGGETS